MKPITATMLALLAATASPTLHIPAPYSAPRPVRQGKRRRLARRGGK